LETLDELLWTLAANGCESGLGWLSWSSPRDIWSRRDEWSSSWPSLRHCVDAAFKEMFVVEPYMTLLLTLKNK